MVRWTRIGTLLIATLISWAAIPGSASAQLVSYTLGATVGSVQPDFSSGLVVPGQSISGTMTVDTAVSAQWSSGTSNYPGAVRLVLNIGSYSWSVTDRLFVVDAPASGGGCCGADHVNIDSGNDGVGPSFGSYVFANVALAFSPVSDWYEFISSSTVMDGLKIIDSNPFSLIRFIYVDPGTGSIGQIRGAATLGAPTTVPLPPSSLLLGSTLAGFRKLRRRQSSLGSQENSRRKEAER